MRTAAWPGGDEPSDMIHEILPSDVELARGMLDSSHSDAEILAYLASRGIEPSKAAELVDDLRHGRTPTTQFPYGPGAAARRATVEPRAADRQAHQTPDSPPRHSHRRKHKRSAIPWWFVLLVLIFIFALGYILFEAGREVTSKGIQQDRHELPPAPGK